MTYYVLSGMLNSTHFLTICEYIVYANGGGLSQRVSKEVDMAPPGELLFGVFAV